MQKKTLVTGANGQLGNEIRLLSGQFPQFQFTFVDIDTLDLTNQQEVEKYIVNNNFNYIINCAAYTAVDKAEDDKETAFKVNRDAMSYLARAAQKIKAKIIHISTDYVYDGNATKPYKENDPVNPQSVYGESKLEGENELRKFCPESIIIRTSWLYSTFGNNFVKTMIRLGREKESLNVVSDQIGTPTYAKDLAQAILHIITWVETKENLPVGIFHYSNKGEISWYDFAVKIHELAGIKNCHISPVPTSSYPTKAKRPAYSVLDKHKIEQTFQLEVPDWRISLQNCIKQMDLSEL